MKSQLYRSLLLGIMSIFIHCAFAELPFKGEYLGKTPPGNTPEVFDEGEITGNLLAFNFSFSPDGNELFFSYRRGTPENPNPWYEIKYMKQVEGVWTSPQTAFFSGTYSDVDITFSPDGQRLFFASDRHNPGSDMDIYYMDKTEKGWSQPLRIKGEVNSVDGGEVHASISRGGTLVFRSKRPGGYGHADLYLADYVDGEFVNVRNMGPNINTQYLESDCFIAQDGSYILYNAIRPEHNNKPNIYVTFKQENGEWSKGVPLGKEVNSIDGTLGSVITPDRKYLIYSACYGKKKAQYWVSTDIITKMKFKDLEGPYLGQTPPGMKPQLFAPNLISTEDHQGSSGFNKECTHFVFQHYDLKNKRSLTYEMERIHNKWTQPQLLPFEQMMANGDFVISPDGKTMIFQSNAKIEGLEKDGRISNLWKVVKTENGWTTPEPLGGDINSKWADSFASETADGILYYFSRRPEGFGKSDMYKAVKKNGKYQKSENLGELFNTEHHEWDPFIAPDESYLIFCSTKPGGFGKDDFYISFKLEDGSWSTPQNMGPEINSEGWENRPYVSTDGKYFFYTSTIRGNRDIYWVDVKYLEKYRPTKK